MSEATPFGIYLHIPYCKAKCRYCDFYSAPGARGVPQSYVDALLRELAKNTRRPDTLYFGGGTPTILSAGQLDQICTAVEKNFDLSRLKEYTVEAGRPDTIDREKLRTLRRHRVTRISINPQTLNDGVLRNIGRRHTAEQFYEAFDLARRCGFCKCA